MRRLFTAVLLLLLSLPGVALARHVLYPEGERADPKPSFFMDRAGDLYPPAMVIVDTRGMLVGDAASPEFATLRGLYRRKAAEPANAEFAAVLASAGVSPSGDFDRDWAQVQENYRSALADRIHAAAKGRKHVVLLIHGFNNDYREASAWYAAVEEDFSRYAAAYGGDVAFVRMYWDGLSANPAAIWTMAQANGPIVGQELRRLLNKLDGDLPLRVFTHSSGAFVFTNAIGDGSSAFPKLGEPYRSRAAGVAPGYAIPAHLVRTRLAMLVPAQPLTAFSNFHRQGQAHGLIPERVVLGLSKYDFATGKGRAWTSCKLYGATCMTTRVKEACGAVWRDLQIQPPALMLVDFPQPAVKSHDHAVAAYMRDVEWAELARGLLADEPYLPAGNRLCTGPGPALKKA